MSIIDALGSFHQDAIRTTCEGEGDCILRLDGYSKYIILKGEEVRENSEEICDALVFINETIEKLFIVVVEFKSESVHVDKLVNQIQNGSRRAIVILENDSRICMDEEKKCLKEKKFYHIAVAKHWNAIPKKKVRERKIMVGSRPHPLYTKECGDFLKNVIL